MTLPHDTEPAPRSPSAPGRREQNKRATRVAIAAAARELFAAQGYEATSVREIATAAGVAERTFYRYFDGKEGLLGEQLQARLTRLRGAIASRPAAEPPLTAVRRALAQITAGVTAPGDGGPLWLFSDQPRAVALLHRSAPRPLLRLEAAIAEALLARPAVAADPPAADRIDLLARVAVAVMRTAAIRWHALTEADPATAPPLTVLLERAFDELAGEIG